MIKLKFIRDLSIKNKLVVIILLVTYLSISLGFAFFAIWDINRIKSEIQSNLLINAKLLGNYCVVPLTFGDHQQATEALSSLRYVHFIEKASLYDNSGTFFAGYPDTLNQNSFLELPEQQNNVFEDGYFWIKEPVLFQDEVYGTLFMKANSSPLTAVRKNLIVTLSLFTIMLIFLSIILAGRLQRFISLPIIKLKDHIDKIAENQDFSTRLMKLNNDETGSLYDGFNNLLNQIIIRKNERDKAEKNLRESEEKYRRISDNSPAVLYQLMMTPEGGLTFTYISHKVVSVMGVLPEDVMKDSSKLLGMVHPEDQEMFQKSIRKSAESLESFPITFRCMKDGEEIWIEAQGMPTPRMDGSMIWDGFFLDITERKQAETKINNLNKNLEKLVKDRTRELEQKYKELEKMNEVFVGREFRIKELKNRIEELTLRK